MKGTLLMVVCLLSGCVGTVVVSQVNPDTGAHRFNKVMVFGKFEDLWRQRLAEEELCEEIARVSERKCVQSLKTFFPKQGYTKQEISARLSQLGVDAVLTLRPKGVTLSTEHTTKTSPNDGFPMIGDTDYKSSTTKTYESHSANNRWLEYEAVLWSPSEEKTVWYAESSSNMDAFREWGDLIDSVARKTVSQLAYDGFLK